MAEYDSEVRFQIPIFDIGSPMYIGMSIEDEEYIWEELYTPPNSLKSPWPLLGQGTEVASNSIDAIPVLKSWIDECLTSHPACKDVTRSLPTWVLDVSNNQVSLFISGNQRSPYAALSHCWGKVPLIQTTSSTLHDRISGIPWDDLSSTFQDAMTTTRLLGLKYLWMDSLCILQDDQLDWSRESAAMASIYEVAQIVLAANDAPDGTHGFLHDRNLQPVGIIAEHKSIE